MQSNAIRLGILHLQLNLAASRRNTRLHVLVQIEQLRHIVRPVTHQPPAEAHVLIPLQLPVVHGEALGSGTAVDVDGLPG